MPPRPKTPDEFSAHGAAMLRRVFPLLARLAPAGTRRDKARNRRLLFSQYAALILVGLFNPILQSARALVRASGLKAVGRLTGGRKVSEGSFSEASSVFEPHLLEAIVKELRSRWHRQRLASNRGGGPASARLAERLVAVDASVLSALPQIAGRMAPRGKGQWRFHVVMPVLDGLPAASKLTEEPATGERSERNVLTEIIKANPIDLPAGEEGHVFLMDRGYRSANLFNRIKAAGHDYVCRLNRTDGRPLELPGPGEEPRLPPLSEEARSIGIVADELITLGGRCGASPIDSDHTLRRITLIPPANRPSSARQGRVRTDQTGRDELVLATTLVELPAEEIVRLYEHRWEVELFFRFLKQVLGCKRLLSAKTAGVRIQLYCAIIAGLLLALATGGSLTRRQVEMVQLYFSGWADEDELRNALSRPQPP